MDKETWAPVCAPFSEFYEVSTLGRVRGRIHGRILKPGRSTLAGGRPGYMKVLLSDRAGTVRSMSVHRLVAMAFIPGDHALDVNHLDCDKTNNAWTNLEWATHSANIRHGMAAQPEWGERLRSKGMQRARPVIAIVPQGPSQPYPSLNAAARDLGMDAGNILHAIQSSREAYGLRWAYV